jgi:hypothetical protein
MKLKRLANPSAQSCHVILAYVTQFSLEKSEAAEGICKALQKNLL